MDDRDIERIIIKAEQPRYFTDREFIVRTLFFISIIGSYIVSHIGIYLDNIYIISSSYGYCVFISFVILLKEKFYSNSNY